MPWESIKYVGGWFTLVAFIVAAVFTYLKYIAKLRSKMLESTPDQDKSMVVDKVLGRFDVNTSTLTKEQKYNLAMTQIQNSQRRYQGGLVLAGIATILLFSLWGASVILSKDQSQTYRPPRLTSEQEKQLESYIENAKFARDNQRYAEALEYYRKAAEIDNNNPNIIREIESLDKKTGGGK